MPVSSTLTTSAPKSASSCEQKPPGSSRERSSTRTSLSGSSVTPRHTQHLSRLGDQVAVGARHLAVWQVEVVLEPGADVAAQRQRGAEQPPLVARDPDDL